MTNIDDAIERAEKGRGNWVLRYIESIPACNAANQTLTDTYTLAAEVKRLRDALERANEELRQGWPKLARDANRSAIEQWNRADAAEAEVKRLREALDRCRKGINTWDDK